jgi:alpha-L-rhamnosidase
VFEPRFTTHGFRYVRVEGHPWPLGAGDVTGVVVHSDLRRLGWFSCSDDRVNRLHEAVVWSLRSNICDIPTDCPQRERAGWTGDWQVFAPTAAYLYDVLAFTRKWLGDVVLDQRADGCVANMSPCPPAEGFGGPLGGLHGSAVPVGHRLPLGRVAGTRGGGHRFRRVHAGGQVRGGHGLPAPLGGDYGPGGRGAWTA